MMRWCSRWTALATLAVWTAASAWATQRPPSFAEDDAWTVVVATTNTYPDERSEIEVVTDLVGNLRGIAVQDYVGAVRTQRRQFSVAELNSGVVLKEQFGVELISLKGVGMGPEGGDARLRYRKSNWTDDRGQLFLELKRDPQTGWGARVQGKEQQGRVLRLHILVWAGFGFGISGVEIR